ncbi:MAG: hypothetical protein HY841_06890 [Bacteroidetes bacterium]|nr:hypothetical protein [Bacteroidota bacterium]
MSIEIKQVKSKSDAKQFVNLPFDIYKGNKFWVPPLKAGEMKSLFAETNPAFDFCKAKFWLAYKNGKCVGRIGAIINEEYNKKTDEKMARFSRLEFFDGSTPLTTGSPEVIAKLISTVEAWAKENGAIGIHGPLGFANLDTQGMLVEGFNHLQSIGSVYHHEYYHRHLEKLGYVKEIDWLEFRLTVNPRIVDKVTRGAALIQKRYGIEVLHFKTMNELLPHSDTIFKILNDAFSELPFVSEFSPKMMAFYKEKYIKLLNPEFVKMVIAPPPKGGSTGKASASFPLSGGLRGALVGFIVGLPSLSEAMQKANGKLFPFGFLHILKARKGKDVMDQLLTGVKKEVMYTGAGVVLMAEIQKEMVSKGMKHIETTGIFETNLNAISNWKSYEHIQHKRKRCYRKMF